MKIPETTILPDFWGALFCLLGIGAQFYVANRLKVPRKLNAIIAVLVAVCFGVTQEKWVHSIAHLIPSGYGREWIPGLILAWCMFTVGASVLVLLFGQIPGFRPERRKFLHVSTAAACAIPAVIVGGGFITRKDFRVNEIDLKFPNLPKDLQGLRLLQLSDIHIGSFFSRRDLERVVDASNTLRADLALITGDLITTGKDPLDDCLSELSRLKATSGILGCMGNHELYSRVQNRTKRYAAALGMDFLRYERRHLQFGSSGINLVGVDYESHGAYLAGIDDLISPDAFNLLLSHTPDVFPTAKAKGFQLTLAGHTHGGQINVQLAGANFNLVELNTPYTRGLYRMPGSLLYVNSGLGTIGVPVRIGSPPEITLIRLCNS